MCFPTRELKRINDSLKPGDGQLVRELRTDPRVNPLQFRRNSQYLHCPKRKSCKLQASEPTSEKRGWSLNSRILGKLAPTMPVALVYCQPLLPAPLPPPPLSNLHFWQQPYYSLDSVARRDGKLSCKNGQVLLKRHFRQVGLDSPPLPVN